MSRRNRDVETRETRAGEPAPAGRPFLPPDLVRVLTLAGVGVVIFMNARIWSQTGKFEQAVEKVDRLDGRIAQLSQKVDAIAARAAAQPPRQGPDPNKVYTVKTAGAPAEGPENAPVTIAEFSDFQ